MSTKATDSRTVAKPCPRRCAEMLRRSRRNVRGAGAEKCSPPPPAPMCGPPPPPPPPPRQCAVHRRRYRYLRPHRHRPHPVREPILEHDAHRNKHPNAMIDFRVLRCMIKFPCVISLDILRRRQQCFRASVIVPDSPLCPSQAA